MEEFEERVSPGEGKSPSFYGGQLMKCRIRNRSEREIVVITETADGK